MSKSAAEHQRTYRRSRAQRLRVGEALAETGRIGLWSETDLAVIDSAILKLACEWAESVSSNGLDPLSCGMDLQTDTNDDNSTEP
jgi:hypothetical protein